MTSDKVPVSAKEKENPKFEANDITVCYFCQEKAAILKHNTLDCPFKVCKGCKGRGHSVRNCEQWWREKRPKVVFTWRVQQNKVKFVKVTNNV